MFIRIKKFKNKDGSLREYLFIVENQWVKGKVKQKTIANLGRVDKALIAEKVDSLIESISKYSTRQELVNICNDITPMSSKTYGEIIVFRKLWEGLGLNKIFSKHFEDTKKEIDLVEAIFALVCNRLIAPSSKREADKWKDEVYEPRWDKLHLHHLYRALDFLQENKEVVEKELFDNTKDLFKSKVDVMMFDTTNISYWGDSENELLKYGHSKNKRFDLKQLVIGLIMDKNGVPLGHEVWPGNKSDRPAFKEIIEKIKRKFEIDKIILVCDRGMVSESNISYLEENDYEYVLGMRMRQLSERRRKILLDGNDFQSMSKNLSGKEITESDLWEKEQNVINEERLKQGKKAIKIDEKKLKELKESKHGQRRWVVCLNKEVANEDKEKRAFFKKILENKVAFSSAKDWMIRNGYRRYLNIKEMRIEIDHEKLEEEKIYDGKWVLISNTVLPKMDLILTYKDLAQIERLFRDLKSELEIGPVYHYMERRIRAHVFVCFLALQMKVALTKNLKEISKDLTYSEVIRDLSKIKAVAFKVKEKEVIMRTDLEEKAHFAFKASGCTIPPKIISYPSENIVPTSV